MNRLNDESVSDIIKDIDCAQQTQQHSVTIQHNWSISDICELISAKRPGEKIESEQFSYLNEKSSRSRTVGAVESETTTTTRGHTRRLCESCSGSCRSCSNQLNSSDLAKDETPSNVSRTESQSFQNIHLSSPSASLLPLHVESLCAAFLSSASWRLEINRSSSDLAYLSVTVILMKSFSGQLGSSSEPEQLNETKVKLKASVFLFNEEMNETFERQPLDVDVDLKNFFGLKPDNLARAHHKLADTFTIDKFCRIKDLIWWLDRHKSEDFCLLTQFNLYGQSVEPSNGARVSKVRFQPNSSGSSSSSSSSGSPSHSSSSSPSPTPPDDSSFNLELSSAILAKMSESGDAGSASWTGSRLLLFQTYKHAWTIKGWRHFLMPGSTTHTFMNDADISNVLSQSSESSSIADSDSIKFGRFRSKLFKLLNSSGSNKGGAGREAEAVDSVFKLSTPPACKNCGQTLSPLSSSKQTLNKRKIESLLKDVKWKLQLYPNGYNSDYEKTLSLFVNFSQLSGELARFTPSSSSRRNLQQFGKPSVNSAKSIEEMFYDFDHKYGVNMLIKSASLNHKSSVDSESELGSEATAETVDLNNNNNSQRTSDAEEQRRKSKNKKGASTNLCDLFVKASFQISIMDSQGKKVDKCQSEKQLFELYGSWGYKEYMTVEDLMNAKEKYLTDGHSTLNLNCKIILFYTLTTKSTSCQVSKSNVKIVKSEHASKASKHAQTVQSQSELSKTGSVSASLSCDAAPSSKPAGILKSPTTSSEEVSAKSAPPRKSTSSLAALRSSSREHRSYNPLKECNTLMYDLRRLFKQSSMHDLIVQAPVKLDPDLDLPPFGEGGLFAPGRQTTSSRSNLKQFKAHKLILAIRSEVFERMFNNGLFAAPTAASTAGPSVLDIVDFDAFTVEVFLNYLYTDTLEINFSSNSRFNFKASGSGFDSDQEPESDQESSSLFKLTSPAETSSPNSKRPKDSSSSAKSDEDEDTWNSDTTATTLSTQSVRSDLHMHIFVELFKMADKYCVHRLKQLCEHQLGKLLTDETAVELLILAYMHSSARLKRACYAYLAEHIAGVIAQPSWLHLEKNYPKLLAEAFRVLYLKQNSKLRCTTT